MRYFIDIMTLIYSICRHIRATPLHFKCLLSNCGVASIKISNGDNNRRFIKEM